MLHGVARDYKGLEGVTGVDKGLQLATRSYRGLQGVYQGLEGVKEGCKG